MFLVWKALNTVSGTRLSISYDVVSPMIFSTPSLSLWYLRPADCILHSAEAQRDVTAVCVCMCVHMPVCGVGLYVFVLMSVFMCVHVFLCVCGNGCKIHDVSPGLGQVTKCPIKYLSHEVIMP